jgi:hypothetical protein
MAKGKDVKFDEKGNVIENDGNDLSDIEIAELANKALREKEEELAKLRKDLAKAKLYSNAEEEVVIPMTREECLNTLSNSRTTNYDYVEAVCGLVDIELDNGNPNPLGKNGEDVYTFFKGVIEECDGDKSRFTSIYQSRIGNDDKSTAFAYNKRDKN